MKALPVYISDSPLCRALESDGLNISDMTNNNTRTYYGAGTKGRILRAIRQTKELQGDLQQVQLPLW